MYTYLPSPLGDLLAVRGDPDRAGSPGGVSGLYLPTGRHPKSPHDDWPRADHAFGDLRDQLDEYFAGTRRRFDLALDAGGTHFQKKVWQALVTIPYGHAISYGTVAAAIGVPTASRAVGLANGQNPISVIVPCHRVVGANGSLTGYGGGLDAKRWLLSHELRHAGLFA